VTDRILIVDDQRQFGDLVANIARTAGFEVAVTERTDDFLAQLEPFSPTLLMIDLMMPEGDGISLLRELASRKCAAAILLISGLDVRTLSWADALGRQLGLHMAGTVGKPVRAAELRARLADLKKTA
jgi:DNA-binding response OmpR family regulator